MHEPDWFIVRAARTNGAEQISHPFHIDAPRQVRVEFAGLEGAVAGAIQYRAKSMFGEQFGQSHGIFGVAGDDSLAREAEVVALANPDDLARITFAEMMEGVISGNAGDARH